jgi:hypothetical protein
MPSPLSSAKQRPQLAMDPTASFSSTSSSGSSSDANDNDDDGRDDVAASLLEKTPFTAQADVYGQFHPLESPALLTRRLVELDAALCAMMMTTMTVPNDKSHHHHNKQQSKGSGGITSSIVALREAQTANPTLFRDESLRLMFLRAECFRVQVRASCSCCFVGHHRYISNRYLPIVQDAARRFGKYWERRIELFGHDEAFQTTIGLDKASAAFLRRGVVTWIRRPDNDRDILFVDPSRLDPTAYSRKAAVRAVWYVLHTVLAHDVRVQQKGLICLAYPRHVSHANRDPALTKQCLKVIQSALPLRITAVHCSPIPTLFYWVLQFILCFVDDRVRQRLIVHGDIRHETDLAERLEREYGIAATAVPRQLGGRLDLASSSVSSPQEEWCINVTATTTTTTSTTIRPNKKATTPVARRSAADEPVVHERAAEAFVEPASTNGRDNNGSSAVAVDATRINSQRPKQKPLLNLLFHRHRK